MQGIQKLQAVYAVLNTYLEGNGLLDAVLLYEFRFIDHPESDLRRFVQRLSRFPSIQKHSGQVLLELENVLSGKTQIELRTLPPALAARRQAQLASNPNLQPNQGDLFTHFLTALDALEAILEHSVFLKLKAELAQLDTSQSETTDRALSTAISNWGSGTHVPRVNCNRHQLRAMFNRIYQILCELQGPMATDRHLGQLLNNLQTQNSATYREMIRIL